MKKKKQKEPRFKFPGRRVAVDGNTAVVMCERESSDAAGAFPITPSTQMGEYWAEAAAAGHLNISGRPLIFIEPEGEHAAAAVTAGLAMTGLRAANFSSGQGIAYMHESLYAAVGKRLTYILNIGARAMTKANLNVHAGHDDYHCIDDTGFFQLFARDAQSVADLNIIAHRIAELALTPGVVAQDGFLTTHLIESVVIPERELIAEYLGRPDDLIDTPTPAQKIIYGPTRRRIPELWDVDNPVMAGLVQNQEAFMQSVAAQRPFFFDHIPELAARAFDEFHELTGRRYDRVRTYRAEDADYLILGQGSMIPTAEAVADYLRETRDLKIGVVDLVMFRPFPADLLSQALAGKKAVTILERLDQPLAVDLPLMRETRATISRCLENGRDPDHVPFPGLAVFEAAADAPALYSGSFGLGSRDLHPEGIIGAVENMLPEGARRKFFYLSIDFLRDKPITPKQQIYQETIADAYPHVRELAVHGSENPNLMPEGSITVRFHSVGGWGAITTGKNLAMTLYGLLGYHIKANPKYGSEKKGQPTTYYLSAAPEPIRVNCEYFHVDAVLSPDPNVFQHTNALAGLKEGGVFVIQGDQPSPEALWSSISPYYRKIIVEKNIQVFYLDAFKIAREEATDPDLQLRMQGIAFQGAFFAATPVAEEARFSEERLLEAIRSQLQHKFGAKGARVVEENLRVVKRGFDEVQRVSHGSVTEKGRTSQPAASSEPALPIMLKRLPKGKAPVSDIHRFWEQTGSFYARGMGSDSITDPFIGLGVMPAATAVFRDMTGIRFWHPEWIAENCTACGACYAVCPDTAIPGLVSEVGAMLDTVVKRLRKHGKDVPRLAKGVRVMERHLRAAFSEATETDKVNWMVGEAIDRTLADTSLEQSERDALKDEFDLFREELDGFQFALTRPHYTLPEKDSAGEGGLFSITINPTTCKGCMECIAVCDDDALRSVTQTKESVEQLRRNWDFWLDLPNTPEKYIRVDDLEEGIGTLENILLNKENYLSFTSGDGACLGCGEKTSVHLFVATVEALMQPRIERHLAYLTGLVEKLEEHVQLKLVHEIQVGDSDTIAKVLGEIGGGGDVTLATIAERVEEFGEGEPIDQEWLRRVTGLLAKLKNLKWKYTEGTTGRGRAKMGMLNATGCTSVWGSTYPFNPYPFPWANHLFQDSASMAMGVFEGHMAKMAEGFKAIREAELELSGDYQPSQHDEALARFGWEQFTDEEWELCPPVVAVGGDGAMYHIGFQNLSRALMSGKPIKVFVLDTQVYSNTGGQACTSGFFGQVSDMAPFGAAKPGKQEVRKEIGLIAMAHRTAYVMQSSFAHRNHMIEGFIQGLKARRPALFNLYAPCQPEHGIGDDKSFDQSKLAVESRAYPLFRYNPDEGPRPEDCFDLEGNPAPDQDWPTYTLKYLDGDREKTMELPLTFADFALTEIRFRKHFRVAPPDTWNENMVPLAEFLDLPEEEREGCFPYVWSVDRNQQLTRLLVAEPIVRSCEDRRDFWTMLRAIARVAEEGPAPDEIEAKVRRELSGQLAQGLMRLIGSEGEGAPLAEALGVGAKPTPQGKPEGDYLAPWIDSDQCTACDECVNLNPSIFEYNADKKAVIKENWKGPYKDLVKAAERFTARVIHPGLPRDHSEKGVEKLIKRAEKYRLTMKTMGALSRLLALSPKTFRHGIHPPGLKEDTRGLPIHQFPFAPVLVMPLSQHIGKPAVPLVQEGEEVVRGQCIARPDGFVSVALHAPASGVVRRIGLTPSIDGRMRPGIFIEPFPASTQERFEGTPCNIESASAEEIISAVQQAGIVGLGGAGFPTHAKMRIPEDKHVDTIIINGAECEPYLTADHRVMLDIPEDVVLGIRYLLRATGAKEAIIAVEDNKLDAADALRAVLPAELPIRVEVVPAKYPLGAAEVLIKTLLGREKPAGSHAVDIHTLVFNVSSTSEIGRLLPHGAGLQERVITVSGPAIDKKGNYRIPIGSPLRFVLETVGVHPDLSSVVLGGPMLGQAVSNLDIPIIKGTLGVIALTERETGRLSGRKEYPCIRCAACLEACPLFLNPAQLGKLALHQEYQRMADEFHLDECFECGCCTYVCPSHIPLAHRFRIAKAAVRKAKVKV